MICIPIIISAERKGYSGTGLYCKSKPDKISFSPWDDMNSEGRIIQADFGDSQRSINLSALWIIKGGEAGPKNGVYL